jgi:hypothetical protein
MTVFGEGYLKIEHLVGVLLQYFAELEFRNIAQFGDGF